MVHIRLNSRETDPNPHINFITALPTPASPEDQENARQLLRALAAQVRPVMKAHGFVVNTLEEYEHNQVFSGRNWNNGEVVELVLRGANGLFLPIPYIMSTLCHELAHIQHMNHGPVFQALWVKLRTEVRALQEKGYYGDGYWSAGKRLADSVRTGGQTLDPGGLPEYMCGGAQSRTKPISHRRRRNTTREAIGPSRKRKAGTRVRSKFAFQGEGQALDAAAREEGKTGTGFRKRAVSNRAREERALAAEKRLKALQSQNESQSQAGPSKLPLFFPDSDDDDSDDSDTSVVQETDQDRRRAMLDVTSDADLAGLKTSSSTTDFSHDFILPPATSDRDDDDDDIIIVEAGGTSTQTVKPSKQNKQDKGKGHTPPLGNDARRNDPSVSVAPSSSGLKGKEKFMAQTTIPYGTLVKDEIQHRKRESLGMTGSGKRLGGSRSCNREAKAEKSCLASRDHVPKQDGRDHNTAMDIIDLTGEEGVDVLLDPLDATHATGASNINKDDNARWCCLVCTFENASGHLACGMCATPRGDAVWSGGGS